MVDSAIAAICAERIRDPQGTIPIDIMASQRAIPINNHLVMAGKARAQKLLPFAKRLVPVVLSRIAGGSLDAYSHNQIVARIAAVDTIKVEVEERENSAWRPRDPRSIIFGTIFLTGLRSNEAMIAVLAHELTHAASGTEQILQPFFTQVGSSVSQLGLASIGPTAAMELACEIVGIQVALEYIDRTSAVGMTKQRVARVLEKNCVSTSVGDNSHLSPRATMRVLLSMNTELTRFIVEPGVSKRPKKRRRSM
ncbi:MAG TPA: hypothetical protein VK619_05140 [Pyrinomonadaceae bacterium]|nr:hypothetical protein [Pyrinomonadaceae bacterium]